MAELPELDRAWRSSSSFRTALAQLLTLNADALYACRSDSPQGPAVPPPNGVEEAQWDVALNAYRTLYTYAREFGPTSVAARAIELSSALKDAPPRSPTIEHDLEAALAFNSLVERNIAIDNAEFLFMPMAAGIQMYLDLRAVSPPTERDERDIGDRVELIPVVLLQITFDEPVGGNQSTTIQMPWEQVEALLEQIPAINAQLDALRRLLPAGLTRAHHWTLNGGEGDAS